MMFTPHILWAKNTATFESQREHPGSMGYRPVNVAAQRKFNIRQGGFLILLF